jgi:hypothetical protein
MGEKINGYRVLVEKPKGWLSFGGLRHMCEDNIKTDLKEIGWESVD